MKYSADLMKETARTEIWKLPLNTSFNSSGFRYVIFIQYFSISKSLTWNMYAGQMLYTFALLIKGQH